MVTFDQLKEMRDDATFEIGCISYDSNGYGDDSSILAAPVKDETEEDYSKRVNNDVTAALDVLRENLDKDMVPFFVYPHGETSDVLVSAVQDAGYKAAFIKGESGLILPDSNRYSLERMNVTQDMKKYKFRDLF